MSSHAVFTCAAHYFVQAFCQTPLRTGAGETEDVLRDRSGQMFLQGASLAGPMREWLAGRYSRTVVENLFGGVEENSRLIFSDGVFEKDTTMLTRPRLRINGATGSVDGNGKFDIAHAGLGSQFRFDLFWLGTAEQLEELNQVEEMLAALHYGEIHLGAQKSNGFGRVKLSVKKQIYHMDNAADREAWINDRLEGENVPLSAPEQDSRVRFQVKAYADRILVKSGAPVVGSGRNASYTPNLEEMGEPVIPGSSIKGTVLSRVRAIAELLNVPEQILDEAFGRTPRKIDGVKDDGMAGWFRFEDIYPANPGKQQIARIRIDRFTGGVISQGLFKEEPLTGALTLNVTAPKEKKAACGLLLYALRDLGLGLYNLGSGGAVGRGFLRVREITAACGTQTVKLTFDGQGGCVLEDTQDLCRKWMDAVEEIRHEN